MTDDIIFPALEADRAHGACIQSDINLAATAGEEMSLDELLARARARAASALKPQVLPADGWHVVRTTRTVRSYYADAFLEGDWTVGQFARGCWTCYSFRLGTTVAVGPRSVRVAGEFAS